MRRAALIALAALAVGACGGDDERPASTRLVKPGKPPLVNAFDVDPRDGSFLMATNRGFFRIARDGGKLTRLRSSLSAPEGRSRVGTFLAFVPVGKGGEMLGSGHPDEKKSGLPQFLGVLRSADGGRTWRSVSRMGLADLHVIRPAHDRIYAFDAVLGGMLISDDGGKDFVERPTPRELMTDFVVAPDDPRFLLAASDDGVFRSTDEGEGWRPLPPVRGARFAWPSPKKLYRTTAEGEVQLSDDRGQTWQGRGRIDGEPWRLKALAGEHLVAALATGAIVESRDGGREWDEVFTP